MNISGINFAMTPTVSSVGKTDGVKQAEAVVNTENVSRSKEIATDDIGISSDVLQTANDSSETDKASTVIKTPEIMVMREKGLETLVKMIDDAKESIDLHIYIVTANTPELTQAFHRALDRGVKVRLMVENDPFYWTHTQDDPSKAFIDDMVSRGAEYKPDNPRFSKTSVTHEKSMVFDGKRALVLTGNLGSSTFNKNLDLGAILIDDQKVVDQIETIFNSDWDRVDLPDMGETNLVISPDNARSKLQEMMGGAKKKISVLQQAITDAAVVDLLAKKVESGVKADLTITDPGVAQNNLQPAAYLHLKGADVHFLVSPYIHAKAVNVDSDTKDGKTYVGSQNFSKSAIDKNRELGYIFHDDSKQLDGIIERYQKKGFEIPSKMIITDPRAIGSAVKGAIRTAEKSIILETGLFSDTATRSALIKAAKNGVDVSVVMPQNPFPWDPNCTTNIETAEVLKKGGVKVQWADPTYKPATSTSMVVDSQEAITFPDNLSKSAFAYNHTYGVINIAPKEVNDIENILMKDLSGVSEGVDSSPVSDVVTSPGGNARQQLKNLLNDAKESIIITTKELSDKEMAGILKQKAKQGVEIHVLMEKAEKKSAESIKELQTAGVKFQFMTDEKVNNNYIEVDKQKAYSGAHSLSADSMDKEKGIGCMITHEEMIRMGRGTFSDQWLKAGILGASDKIVIEQNGIDTNRDLKELIGDVCKKGVKIHVLSSSYDTSTTKAEFELLNKQLREMATLDPSTQENLDTLSKYFGTFFDTQKAVEAQAKLQKALSQLKEGEELLTGEQKNLPASNKTNITIDGKVLDILPSRNEEIAEMNK